MKFSLLNVLFIVFILYGTGSSSSSSARRLLFRGRPVNRYGMLRPPVPDNYVNTLAENWYNQRVDHFNTSDTRTFKQLYFVNHEHYKTGGPVFLMLGGEGASSDYFIRSGAIATYAKKFNALTVELEHRYYGRSVPTVDLSVDNLRYLSSEQALKDAEQFVQFLVADRLALANSKWIVFGGSYSGALAAWFREKYPNAVNGAVASSGPVEARYDFKEYLGVVSQSLGTDCSNQIREAVHQLEAQLKTPEGWQSIDKELKLCTPLNGSDTASVNNLMETLTDPIASAVQYNSSNGNSIGRVCSVMTNTKDGRTPLERYVKLQLQVLHGGSKCLDYDYMKMIDEIRQSSKTSTSVRTGMRQWTYQTCTEFGYYQTTGLPDSPFGHNIPIDYFSKQCTDIFGKQFNADYIQKAVQTTNTYYGGVKPTVTKVVFPNGSTDPWHALSVLKDLNNSTRAVLIHGTSHCVDMYAPSANDPHELTDARQTIEKQLQL
ncbi:putative serine protease K12H4.7 [Oppia nitens]|uniref:putative serine protease K12H4.7 n=1 Tax=Oppia nitens TaxID=1686743 RepID=UPI0023D9C933|nr:putative serine protease K12H4.7 [Oppia nitens]